MEATPMNGNAARCPRCNGSVYFEIEPDETPIMACLLCSWRKEGPSPRQRQYERELAQLAPEAEPRRGRPRTGEERPVKVQLPAGPRSAAAERKTRDAEILRLARLGLSNTAIAARFDIGEGLVSRIRNLAGVGSHPQRARKNAASA